MTDSTAGPSLHAATQTETTASRPPDRARVDPDTAPNSGPAQRDAEGETAGEPLVTDPLTVLDLGAVHRR